MKQFLLQAEFDNNGMIRLDGKDYHYLVNVRRLAAGECFPALSPNGEEVLIKIVSINKKMLTGMRIIDPPDSSPNSSSAPQTVKLQDRCSMSIYENEFKIILFQALPKGDKMDLIVRQAAEGGIAEIVPFTAEFSIGKGNTDGQKFQRWERIIKEARQQSGSKIATRLHHILSIDELLNYWKELRNTQSEKPQDDSPQNNSSSILGLLFHHEKALENNSLHGYLCSYPRITIVVIGPEGGFSEREVSLFKENDFKMITIGDTVLRTETAALYFTAAVRTLLLEKNSWEQK